MNKYKNIDFASKSWREKDISEKIKTWLSLCDGELPTYDKLISNMLKGMEHSDDSIDSGDHEIDFTTPAAIYDRELDVYRPDYEYETVMFQVLLSRLKEAGLIDVSTSADILGVGTEEDKKAYENGMPNSGMWRPYIVIKVSFNIVDSGVLIKKIDDEKEEVSDSVIANIVKRM